MEMDYEAYMREKELAWESQCKRCGACCGAYADPCEELRKDEQGKYYCASYEHRFGMHSSKGGLRFKCVPVRTILHRHWDHEHLCAYKTALRSSWAPK
jgi:hypothetical protein